MHLLLFASGLQARDPTTPGRGFFLGRARCEGQREPESLSFPTNLEQNSLRRDDVAELDAHLRHRAIARRAQHRLRLHRFDRDERVALLHALPSLHRDGDDRPGQRGNASSRFSSAVPVMAYDRCLQRARREARGVGRPFAHEAGRGHNPRGLTRAPWPFLGVQMRQGLHAFAQTHVIAEDGA